MSVSVFPVPASGGGGGGAALPGAVSPIVEGKFKVYGKSTTSVEAGSYVGTVLATASGSTEVDVKKSTSGAVGSMLAGVTTLDTITETEAGLELFAKAKFASYFERVSANYGGYFNDFMDQYENGSNNLKWCYRRGNRKYAYSQYPYLRVTSGAAYSSLTLLASSTNGTSWNYNLNEQMNSETNPKKLSAVSEVGGNGWVMLSAQSSSTSSYNHPKFYKITDTGFSYLDQSSNTSSPFYNEQNPYAFWQAFGRNFASLDDGTVYYSSSETDFNNWTDFTSAFPFENLGSVSAVTVMETGRQIIWGRRGHAWTDNNWTTYNYEPIAYASSTSAGYPGDAGGGYYVRPSLFKDSFIQYSTDLVNWSEFQIHSRPDRVYNVKYDRTRNQWIASGQGGYVYRSSGSNPASGTWSSSSYNSVLQDYVKVADNGYLYSNGYNQPYFLIATDGLNVSQYNYTYSGPGYVQYNDAAAKPDNSVAIYVGYDSTNSNIGVVLRSTNGTNFSEITNPFAAFTGQVRAAVYDSTLGLFTIAHTSGYFATSSDGLTWTITGDLGNGPAGRPLSYLSSYGGTLLASNIVGLVSVSTNGGISFTNKPTSLSTAVPKVYTAQQFGDKILLITSGGIFEQTAYNTTTSYAAVPDTPSDVNQYKLPIKTVNGVVYFFSQGTNVYKSTDYINWTLVPELNGFYDVDRQDSTGYLYASGGAKWAISTDNGASWSSISFTDSRKTEIYSGIFPADGVISQITTVAQNEPIRYNTIPTEEEFGLLYYSSNLEDLA